jgi:excisionase family DNA binding protein
MAKHLQRIMPNLPGLVKVAEAAELLDLSLGGLYRQIHVGSIPYVLVNRHYYISQAVLDDRIESKAVLDSLKQAQRYVARISTLPKRGRKPNVGQDG